MKKAFKYYRRLGSDEPDRDEVLALFNDRSDDELVDALAHPRHSAAAKAILQEVAAQRGIKAGAQRLWEQDEGAMHVAPFGRQPSVEDAIAAPKRWRLIYRSIQFISLAALVLAIYLFTSSESGYEGSLQQAMDAGMVDAALVNRLKTEDSLLDSQVHSYLMGRNEFLQNLRSKFLLALLVGEGSIAQTVNDRLLAEDDPAEIIRDINALAEPDNETLVRAKHEAINDALEEARTHQEAMNALAVSGLPTGVAPIDVFYGSFFGEIGTYEDEIGTDMTQGEHDSALFDRINALPTFRPTEHSGGTKEATAAMALLFAVLLYSLGPALLWRSPRRMLLLRPFQAKKLAKPLQRFVRKNMAFHGHTFTLSDKYVKESRLAFFFSMIPTSVVDFVLIPLSMIPYFRQFKRWLYVKNASTYNFLKRRLRRRKTLARFWQDSWDKTLSTRCSDTWWKAVVDLLMYSCEIIVVDLSWVKSGTEWELGKIDVRDLEKKTVFVVYEPKLEEAHKVIREFWPSDEAPPPLFVFDNGGKLSDASGFTQEMARIASTSHLWEAPEEH